MMMSGSFIFFLKYSYYLLIVLLNNCKEVIFLKIEFKLMIIIIGKSMIIILLIPQNTVYTSFCRKNMSTHKAPVNLI